MKNQALIKTHRQENMEASMDPLRQAAQHVLLELRSLQGLNQLPDPLREELEKALVGFYEADDNDLSPLGETKPEAESDLEVIVSRGKGKDYFIVREEELQLFDSICSGLLAAAGAGFFLLNSPLSASAISATTAIAISIFKLLRRLARKGATVTPAQLQVILLLKKHGKMPIPTLVSWLKKANVPEEGKPKWRKENVARLLNELRRVRLRDGTIISLVDQTPDGEWGVCGVY